MSIFGFLKRNTSADALGQLESTDPQVRVAAAMKVARGPDKDKAVDALLRHYEEVVGIGRYVTRSQWQEALQKWKTQHTLHDVVLFMKMDVISTYQQDGINSRLHQLRDLVSVLEEVAKSTG